MIWNYSVTWLDCNGITWGHSFTRFDEALGYYRDAQSDRGKCSLRLGGEDAEFDGEQWFDGLTDEERELL